MRHLLALIIMFALAVTNGPAVAAAICQHGSASAHAEAMHSADLGVAAGAQAEEEHRKAAKQGSLADGGAALVAGYMLPPDQAVLPVALSASLSGPAGDPMPLGGRMLRPLLRPPLA
ncbi:hypothetical protein [Sphingosinicella terrae]|uniref:hypothetical protein n=1 Tax=Sphingosinicella terrae TaxID=2172047 RepID=UPI0013B41A5B|nr:hypothetical protein [Sphingosinicella terrae]